MRPWMTLGWKRSALQIALACLCTAFLQAQAHMPPADPLLAGFKQPPTAAKMRCYWWWLNGNTTADTITRDLRQ